MKLFSLHCAHSIARVCTKVNTCGSLFALDTARPPRPTNRGGGVKCPMKCSTAPWGSRAQMSCQPSLALFRSRTSCSDGIEGFYRGVLFRPATRAPGFRQFGIAVSLGRGLPVFQEFLELCPLACGEAASKEVNELAQEFLLLLAIQIPQPGKNGALSRCSPQLEGTLSSTSFSPPTMSCASSMTCSRRSVSNRSYSAKKGSTARSPGPGPSRVTKPATPCL